MKLVVKKYFIIPIIIFLLILSKAETTESLIIRVGNIATNVSCENCLNAHQIDDIYVFNTGDIITGNLTIQKNVTFTPSELISITAIGGIDVITRVMKIQGSGGAVTITRKPAISAGVDGQMLTLIGQSDTNTVTFMEDIGVDINEIIVLSQGDVIIFIYDSTLSAWLEISRGHAESEKSWTFTSPAGSSGVFYYGGFYEFAGSSNDFSSSINFGTINNAYGAHFFVVPCSIPLNEITIFVNGTSIFDNGTRFTNDFEAITVPSGAAITTYYETTRKWLGQVSVEIASGTAKVMNYGYAKYWDNNNNNFTVIGLEAVWLGGANDAGADIELLYHKNSGWTCGNATAPSPPTAIARMTTDYVTEDNVKNNLNGAYKRDNLDIGVSGRNGEGIIIKITTTANKAFELGTFLLRIKSK